MATPSNYVRKSAAPVSMSGGGGGFSMWSSGSRASQQDRLLADKGGLFNSGWGPEAPDLGFGKTVKSFGSGLMGLGHLAASTLLPTTPWGDPVEGPGLNEVANLGAGILGSLTGTALKAIELPGQVVNAGVNAALGTDYDPFGRMQTSIGKVLEVLPGDATAEQLAPLGIRESLDQQGIIGMLVEDVGNVALVGAAITAPAKGAAISARLGASTARAARMPAAADKLAARAVKFKATANKLEANPVIHTMKYPYRTTAKGFRNAVMKPAAQRIIAAGGLSDVPLDQQPIKFLAADLEDNGVNYAAVERNPEEMAANAAEYRAAPVDDVPEPNRLPNEVVDLRKDANDALYRAASAKSKASEPGKPGAKKSRNKVKLLDKAAAEADAVFQAAMERNGFDDPEVQATIRDGTHDAPTTENGRITRAFTDETDEQYYRLTNPVEQGGHGVTIEFVDEAEPYASKAEMAADLENNRRMKVSKTKEGDHPRLTPGQNDRFRAVHDAYGHGATGRDFARGGEEAAYIAHAGMYSDDARRVLAAETRGQNAVLIEDGAFPEQKAYVMSPEGTDDIPAILRAQQAPPRPGDATLHRLELAVRGREAGRKQRRTERMLEAERQQVLHSPPIVAAVQLAQGYLIDAAQESGTPLSRKEVSLMVGEEITNRIDGSYLAEDIALNGGMSPEEVARSGVRRYPIAPELRTPEFEETVVKVLDAVVAQQELLEQTLNKGRPGPLNLDDPMVPKMTKKQKKDTNRALKKIKRATDDVQQRKIDRETASRVKYKAAAEDALGQLAEKIGKINLDIDGALVRFNHSRGALVPRAWRKAGAMETSTVSIYDRTMKALDASGDEQIGGASYDPHVGRFLVPGKDKGYAVGLLPGTALKIPLDQFTPQSIETVIRAHQELFDDASTVLGTWVQDGYVHIDVSQIVPDIDDAFILAGSRGQLATFDLANDATINGVLLQRHDIAQQFLTNNTHLKRLRRDLRALVASTRLKADEVDIFSELLMREAVSGVERGLAATPDEFLGKYIKGIEFGKKASTNPDALRQIVLNMSLGTKKERTALYNKMKRTMVDMEKTRQWYQSSHARVEELFRGDGKATITLLDGSQINPADLFYQVLAITSFQAGPRDNWTRALTVFQKFDDLPTAQVAKIETAMTAVVAGKMTLEEAFGLTKKAGLLNTLKGSGLYVAPKQYLAEVFLGVTIDKWSPETMAAGKKGWGSGSVPDRQKAVDFIKANYPDLIERIGEDQAVREFWGSQHRAKIMNFHDNLANPSESLGLTMDQWMQRFFGEEMPASQTKAGIDTWIRTSEWVRDMAEEMSALAGSPVLPSEVQALIWVYAKTEIIALQQGHFNAKAFEALDIIKRGERLDPADNPILDYMDEASEPYTSAENMVEMQHEIMRGDLRPSPKVPVRDVESTVSPVEYPPGKGGTGERQRLVIRDPEAPKKRQKKNAEVIDEADPTVIGYLDFVTGPDGVTFIEHMRSRGDYAGQGIQRQLVERLYADAKGDVDFGKIETAAVETLRRDMKKAHPNKKHTGRMVKGVKQEADEFAKVRGLPRRGRVKEETVFFRPGWSSRAKKLKLFRKRQAKWELTVLEINKLIDAGDTDAAVRVMAEYHTFMINQAPRSGGLADDAPGAAYDEIFDTPLYHTPAYLKASRNAKRLPRQPGQTYGDALKQSFEDTILGEYVPQSDGTRGVIRMFKDGNLATLVHENGHLLRQILPDAEMRMIEGLYGPGTTHGNRKWTRAAEERFANDLLLYFTTGKAPEGMKTTFHKIKMALHDIWKVVGSTFLHRTIHPEVRELFDDWFNPAEQATVTDVIPGRADRVPETGTMPQRVMRKPRLGGRATEGDFYHAGRKGQKAIADVERLSARKRTLEASAAAAQKSIDDIAHVLETGKVPARLEADEMLADARRIQDNVAEQLRDPSSSNVPRNWAPFLHALESLAKEAAKNPDLASLLDEIPQTLADIQALAVSKGFNPTHIREFSPQDVRRLVSGTLRLGKGGGLIEQAAGARKKSTGALRRAGAVEKSVEAWIAASVEVLQETRTNEMVDWVESSAARTIEVGDVIPDGWVAWDDLRTRLLTGEIVSEGTIKATAGRGTTKIIPKSVHNTLMKSMKDYDHAIFRGLNRITSPWRTLVLTMSPGWYVRNIAGNMMMASASNVRLKDWQAAWKSYKTKDVLGPFADVPFVQGASITNEGIEIFDSSIIPRKKGLEGARQAMSEDGKIKGMLHHVSNRMLRVNEVVDEFSRAAVYHNGRRLNMPHEEAWHRASTAMVDYGNLSNFERRIVRSVLPFYSWQKGILNVTLNQFIDHPARTRLIMALGQMHEEYVADQMGLEEEDIPAYYKNMIGDRNLRGYNPFTDAGDLTNVEGITRSLNPFLELAVRKGLGAPRFPDYDNQRVDPFGFVQNDVDAGSELSDMLTSSPGGRFLGDRGVSKALGIQGQDMERLLARFKGLAEERERQGSISNMGPAAPTPR